ncbi:MAG: hypothetical protein IJD52_03070 [Alphaproteobacteria bacterium]|nr:hypothetical protein [Alphaproteobacteria bacterium]
MRRVLALCVMMMVPIVVRADDAINQKLQRAIQAGKIDDAKAAIWDGASNIDELLQKEVAKQDFNYDVVQLLAENSLNGVSVRQMNALYLQALKDVCVYNTKTTDDFKKIASVQPWGWSASGMFLDEMIGLMGFWDYRPDVYICMFDVVSANKIAGAEFINIAAEKAEKSGLENLKTVARQLNEEIQKQTK